MLEIHGHYDGTQVLLDEPCELKPNTKVIVTVVENDEDADWYLLGKKSFAQAYADDEPEIVITVFPQSDGILKRRPALILRETPPFQNLDDLIVV
jgi:hypothetical protein